MSAKEKHNQFKKAKLSDLLESHLGTYEMELIASLDDYIQDNGLPTATIELEKYAMLTDYTNYLVQIQSVLCSVDMQLKQAERDKLVTSAGILQEIIEDGEIKNATERASILHKNPRVIEYCKSIDELGLIKNYVLNKYTILINIMKLFGR